MTRWFSLHYVLARIIHECAKIEQTSLLGQAPLDQFKLFHYKRDFGPPETARNHIDLLLGDWNESHSTTRRQTTSYMLAGFATVSAKRAVEQPQGVAPKSSGGFSNPYREFENPFSECCDLDFGKSGLRTQAPQFLHKDVRGRRHENAKLIGQEVCAARPINFQAVMQFLNPVFGVSPAPVDPVHRLGCVSEAANHEAIIVSAIAWQGTVPPRL